MVSKMHILHLILHFSKEKPRKLLINGVLTSFLEVSSVMKQSPIKHIIYQCIMNYVNRRLL